MSEGSKARRDIFDEPPAGSVELPWGIGMRMTTRRAVWVLLAVAVVWTIWLAFLRPSSAPYVGTPPSSAAYASRAASGDPETRTAAIAELVRRKDDVAVSVFSKMLHEDPDPFFRARAAQSLGKIRGKTAVPALTTALNDKSALVFSSTCWAIGRIGDPNGAEALRPYALQQGDTVRAREAAWALRHFCTKEAEDILLRRLKYPLSQVTVLVVAALGQSGTQRALVELRSLRNTLPEKPELAGQAPLPADHIRHEVAFAVDEAIKTIEGRLEQQK